MLGRVVPGREPLAVLVLFSYFRPFNKNLPCFTHKAHKSGLLAQPGSAGLLLFAQRLQCRPHRAVITALIAGVIFNRLRSYVAAFFAPTWWAKTQGGFETLAEYFSSLRRSEQRHALGVNSEFFEIHNSTLQYNAAPAALDEPGRRSASMGPRVCVIIELN